MRFAAHPVVRIALRRHSNVNVGSGCEDYFMHSMEMFPGSDGDLAELAEIVAVAEHVRADEAAVQVRRVRMLARAADLAEKQAARSFAKTREREMALRSIAAELAGVLQLSDRSVQRQIDDARELVHDYPATLQAWESGRITRAHVRVITDLGMMLPQDIRHKYELAALELCVRLHGLGAHVTVTDPAAIDNARRTHPQLTYVDDRDEALRDADAVIVVSEWDEYRRQLTPEHAASLTSGRVIVDGRNCLDADAWRAAGWEYYGMGRP